MDQTSWLCTGAFLPVNYRNEIFYYDKKIREFFILGMFDNLLIDENRTEFEFQYSEEEVIKLVTKLNRIEAKDRTILEIQRIGVQERIDLQTDFIKNHCEHPLQDKLIKNVVEQQTTEANSLVLFTILSREGADETLFEKWETFFAEWASEFSDLFAEDNNMELSEISIWWIDKPRSVKKVRDPNKSTEEVQPETKENKTSFGYIIGAIIIGILIYLAS